MTQRNRVTPFGEIAAIPFRGAWTGNRGRLHEGEQIVRYSRGDLWIVCALEFHDRHSELWRPGRFTWLFFQDEAQAFAAGHRPCGECRHDAYQRFVAAWQEGDPAAGRPTATAMNRRLQRERIIPRTSIRRRHPLDWRGLPDGTFVVAPDEPGERAALVFGDALLPWEGGRYLDPVPRPRSGIASVVTPPATMGVLRAGYPVQIDEEARRRVGDRG